MDNKKETKTIADVLFPSAGGALKVAESSAKSGPIAFLLLLLFELIKRIIVAVIVTAISITYYPIKHTIIYLWNKYVRKNTVLVFRLTKQTFINIGVNFFLIIAHKKVRDYAFKSNIVYDNVPKEEYDKQMCGLNNRFNEIAGPILDPPQPDMLPLVKKLSAVVKNIDKHPRMAEEAISEVNRAMDEFKQAIVDTIGEDKYNELRGGSNSCKN